MKLENIAKLLVIAAVPFLGSATADAAQRGANQDPSSLAPYSGPTTRASAQPNETETPPTCRGDANFDGRVDIDDVLEVIFGWSDNRSNADLDFNGAIDIDDLLEVLMHFGMCP